MALSLQETLTHPAACANPEEAQQEQGQQQEEPQQEEPQQEEPAPVEPTGSAFFTEEFNSDPQWYYEVLQDTQDFDPESVSVSFDDSLMIFEIPEVSYMRITSTRSIRMRMYVWRSKLRTAA